VMSGARQRNMLAREVKFVRVSRMIALLDLTRASIKR